MKRRLVTLVVLSPYVVSALVGAIFLFTWFAEPPELDWAREALAEGDTDAAYALLSPFETPDAPQKILALIELAEMVEAAHSTETLTVDRVLRFLRRNPGGDEALTALVLGMEAVADGDRMEETDFEPVEAGPDPWKPPMTSGANPEERHVDWWVGRETVEPLAEGLLVDRRILQLACHLEWWSRKRPDDPRIHRAHGLLERTRLVGEAVHARELVLPSGTPLPVPVPLTEPLVVSVFEMTSRDDPHEPYIKGEPPRPPRFVHEVPAGAAAEPLPALAPGAWMIEVRSARYGWRRLRRVLVSDLELVAQSFPGGLVVLATKARKPAAGVDLTVHGLPGRPIAAVTGDAGFAVIRRPPPSPQQVAPSRSPVVIEASVRAGAGRAHVARIRAPRPPRDPVASGPVDTAHLFTDRPIYLPGDTIRGRILVRRHRPEPLSGVFGDTALQPVARPFAGERVVLACSLPGRSDERIPLTLDAHGAASFEIPTERTCALGGVSFEIAGRPNLKLSSDSSPCEIREFRRPPLLMEVEWPSSDCLEEDGEIVVRGRYPAGTASADLMGRIWVTLFTDEGEAAERTLGFRLDGNGVARIALGLSHLDRLDHTRRMKLTAQLVAPDGQVILRNKTLEFDVAETPPEFGPGLAIRGPRHDAVIGRPAVFTLSGPPLAPVLLSVARETALDSKVVILDDRGRAEVALTPVASWWPNVHLVADTLRTPSGETEPESARLAVELSDPAERISVRLEGAEAGYRPGETVTWTLATADPAGKPVPATVAIAVVDEAFFALAADRTDPIRTSLRPEWLPLSADAARSPRLGFPLQALGVLLRRGRIEPPSATWGLGLGGAFGGRRGGRRGLRRRYGGQGCGWFTSELRPTAFFAGNVATGPDGRGSITFTFPGDVTRWRVTLIAADAHRGSATAVTCVHTRLPVSVEVGVPRLFREGDRLRVPVRVHCPDGPAADVTCRLKIDEALTPRRPVTDLALRARPGEAVGAFLDLTAERTATSASIAATAFGAKGEPLDHVEHTLPIRAATHRRARAVSAAVRREAVLTIPGLDRAASPDTIEVEISSSLDGVLRKAARYLTEYPHGCVEQTCSKLVPVLMAHHAACGLKGRTTMPRALSDRLAQGMERLRAMQERRSGGFVWWPGEMSRYRVDRRMSAVVFRFFALMQDAGLDARDHDIVLWPSLRIFARAVDRLKSDPVNPVEAELAVVRLRLFPNNKRALESAQRLVASVDKLAFGTAARLGIALSHAGRDDAARRILARLVERMDELEVASRVVHESPAVRAAKLLELAIAVDHRGPLAGRLADRLLTRFVDGRMDHTAGTAAAVVALSRFKRSGGVASNAAVTVRVQGLDGSDRPIGEPEVLVITAGVEGRTTLPADRRIAKVRVSAPNGRTVFATVRAVRRIDAATAVAEARPIRVERELYRLVADDDAKDGFRREAVVGSVPRGRPLEVVVRATCATEHTYLLVECPIPAGFEPVMPGAGAKWQPMQYDDRLELATETMRGGVFEAVFRMVPGRVGEAVWPPAHAEAMYAPDQEGWSSGLRLHVTETEDAAPARAVVFDPGWVKARCAEHVRRIREAKRDDGRSLALRAFARMPVGPVRAWLANEAPASIGATLYESRTLRAYLTALGDDVWDRLRGSRLTALLAVCDDGPDVARRRLADALVEADLGSGATQRLESDATLSSEERRLFALVAIDHGDHDPDPWRQLERIVRLVGAEDFDGTPERAAVVAERFRALVRHELLPRLEPAVDPFERACIDLWQVQGIGTGARETPARVALLHAVLDLAARALPDDPEAHKKWRERFEHEDEFTNWPGFGSAPPPGYVGVRERLRRLLAGN